MRVALIHALRHSPAPVEAAFARLWPEATLMSLLDTSLAADLARDGRLTPAMGERFLTLARYAHGTDARGILFTCSAFGACIEACAAALPIPVLKPNEAAIEEATVQHRHIGLLSTFQPTLDSMPAEFPPGVTLSPRLAEGALTALDAGDVALHDRLVVEASRGLGGDAILLAQFSMAHLAAAVAETTGKPVFTTPDSGVRKLRRLLGAESRDQAS